MKILSSHKFRFSRSIIAVLSILVCTSCSNNSSLEISLALSKGNRNELEKVIKHYSQNPQDYLKRKAALFLIENMKDYSFKEYILGDRYIQTIDSLCQVQHFVINDFMTAVNSISQHLNKNILRDKCQIKNDLEYVTAEQLIKHIDLCFEALKYPWCKNLDFSDFCEYVLPYRLGEEKPENWIDAYRDSMKTSIDLFTKMNMSNSEICNYLLQKSANKDFFYTNIVPNLPPSSLLYTNLGIGNCKELQALTIYSLKVEFKKVNKGNAYLVTYYHQGKTYPASNPFIIKEDGEVKC